MVIGQLIKNNLVNFKPFLGLLYLVQQLVSFVERDVLLSAKVKHLLVAVLLRSGLEVRWVGRKL